MVGPICVRAPRTRQRLDDAERLALRSGGLARALSVRGKARGDDALSDVHDPIVASPNPVDTSRIWHSAGGSQRHPRRPGEAAPGVAATVRASGPTGHIE